MEFFDIIIKKKHIVCKLPNDKSSKQHFSYNNSLKQYCSELESLFQVIILAKLTLEHSSEFQTLEQSFHSICECVLNVLSESLKVAESNYYEITNGHQFEQKCVMELLNNIVTHWVDYYE